MFCTECGQPIGGGGKFCSHCGTAAGASTPLSPVQKNPSSFPIRRLIIPLIGFAALFVLSRIISSIMP